jgi:putative transposase
MTLCKATKSRNTLPNVESTEKMLYMALKNIAKRWTMPIQDLNLALHQLSIRFDGRVGL